MSGSVLHEGCKIPILLVKEKQEKIVHLNFFKCLVILIKQRNLLF